MYRGSSPIFDIPEFPTLRRVKPLPKRRRTSAPPPPPQPLDILGPDATAEELLAHADSLSARMALQNYYLPMLGGVQDFLASATGLDPSHGKDLDSVDFGVHFPGAPAGGGGGGSREDDDEHGDGDGDYVDHLQQPGNTKKRKVPANASNSPRGGHDASGTTEDETTDRGIPSGRAETDALEIVHMPSTTISLLGQKRGKLTAATLAGLQHKEMLKNRKRQLAAVLGALSHGDTLALDQALSANYPFTAGSGGGFEDMRNSQPPKARLSKRKTVRMARAAKINRQPRHPDAIPLPTSDFMFVCASATADRLIATKEEVAMLRNRFEAELERQAAKAAKLAAASKMMASLPSKGGRTKRSERAQQRARTITNGKSGEQNDDFLDQTLANVRSRGKKKKRSALANASNPHHLRNYVPSRLPHSGSVTVNSANINTQNTLSPIPLRFLSAEIPPRRRKKTAVQPMTQLTNPAEEWICAFCEYDLFYGDEQEYRRAVRNRKKILRRRRRARERAAAAASGNSSNMVKAAEKGGSSNEEYEAGIEGSVTESGGVVAKQIKINKAGEAAASYG